jgi:molybdopterin converting factor small subunit
LSGNDSGPKSREGSVSKSYSEKVSAERIREFCRAVGAEEGEIAPPTFLTVFRAGEFELLGSIGLKLNNVLHGEQIYTYDSASTGIRAGDEVSFQTTLSTVLEKKGGSGRMTFLSFETRIDVASPAPRSVGSSKTTIIVREKA